MVTIEDINENQDSCENANDNNTSDDDTYAWKDLMGKDIRFRLLSSVSHSYIYIIVFKKRKKTHLILIKCLFSLCKIYKIGRQSRFI